MNSKIPRNMAPPPQDRAYPTPPFAPSDSFRDDIFVEPSNPATRTLDFDRMDLREQGRWATPDERMREMMAQILMRGLR